jgi:hypothetical protein
MDISSIHFHDTLIHRVVEDVARDTLTVEGDYPVDWENNLFEPRSLVFDDVLNYEVHEGPFKGSPTILSAVVIHTEGLRHTIRLETNAGYRQLTCTAVRIV